MITINESQMRFGRYRKEDLFRVEQSKLYQKLQHGLPIADFVLVHNDQLLVIEAKSSAPNPNNPESIGTLNEYITKVSDKLINALSLTIALVINRHPNAEEEIDVEFREFLVQGKDIVLCLVIRGHKKEWLVNLQDTLKRKLAQCEKVWSIKALVLNDEQARSKRLIV